MMRTNTSSASPSTVLMATMWSCSVFDLRKFGSSETVSRTSSHARTSSVTISSAPAVTSRTLL